MAAASGGLYTGPPGNSQQQQQQASGGGMVAGTAAAPAGDFGPAAGESAAAPAAGAAAADQGSWVMEVWADNLRDSFLLLREAVEEYPYVAMDTEFPGVVARPTGSYKMASDYHYQTVKVNCDLLKIIQLGITLFNERGERRPGVSTFQFNFSFDTGSDMFAEDSIQLLSDAGLDFAKHRDRGIDQNAFAELMTTSGLVLMDEVRWIVFHGAYDFGYLVKVLTDSPLPKAESDFFELLFAFFPNIYDLKYLALACETLGGSLQKVGNDLGIRRIGTEHQAGSDSVVTGEAFFAMRSRYFEDKIDEERYNGVLYQLGEAQDKLRRRRLSTAPAT